MFNAVLNHSKKILGGVENIQLSAFQWLGIFSAIVFIRVIAEGISTKMPMYFSPENFFFFLHAYGFYLVSFVGLILVIMFATGEAASRVGKFVLILVPLVFLPPIADIIASHGNGVIMTYRQPLDTSTFISLIVSFFEFVFKGPFGIMFFGQNNLLTQLHVNYGIRVEVSLIMLLTAVYIFLKTSSAWKTLCGIVMQYAGLFFIGHFPYLVSFFSGKTLTVYSDSSHIQSFFNPLISSDAIIFGLYLTLSALIGGVIAWINNPGYFLKILKNLRFLRVIHNLFLLSGGIVIGIAASGHALYFVAEDAVIIICAFLSILFYWASAVFYNDSTDIGEDSISNKLRPIPSGLLTVEQSQKLSIISLAISLAFASVVGYAFLIMIVARTSVGYLYSSPAVRLKKIPLISQAALALAYLFTILAGYSVISGNSIIQFPPYISYVVLIGFTLGSGFKDIKDIDGDRSQKILTLPVIFGISKGRFLIGIMGFLSFITVFIFFPGHSMVLLIISLAAGISYFYAATKNNYQEWIIFVIYLSFFASLGILYILGQITL